MSKEFESVVDEGEQYGCNRTRDGSLDLHGQPAIRQQSGTWGAGAIILINQCLNTLAFFGVGVNLVMFFKRVMQQGNAEAANSVSKWTGTVYLLTLLGAFLSDSYWGRYITCAVFQLIFVIGLAMLSLVTQVLLLQPSDCGNRMTQCNPHSNRDTGLFYISIYMVALGIGGYQPTIATFGADQFDEEDPKERHSKATFFSYFYLSLNLGCLFSNTVLDYFEDKGMWVLGLWVSASSAFIALVLVLVGSRRYRHFKPGGNPLARFGQVIVATLRKCAIDIPPGDERLYVADGMEKSKTSVRKMCHTQGFKFLDRAAFLTSQDVDQLSRNEHEDNPWRLCPISQVEEVKCILRLLPIWLCTIIYSVVYTQVASLFIEQGNTMNRVISNFQIPAASMSSFDILSVLIFIFLYRCILDPLACKIRNKGLTELQRMGIGLTIAILAMLSAGIVESYRLKYAQKDCKYCRGSRTLSIFWEIPQYTLVGASEVFMYVAQLEFFNDQAPSGLKSFGSALGMTSISLGNFGSSLLVSIVMKTSTTEGKVGWIPRDLNKGHLDRFYFLLAGMSAINLIFYIACASWYKSQKQLKHQEGQDDRGYRV